MDELIVALDGPGGTGKTTVGRLLAGRLGIPHLDTGAFYRATTLAALRRGLRPEDGSEIARLVRSLDLDQRKGRMLVDGQDVTSEIRSAEIDRHVSAVAAHPEVRRELVERQRSWVQDRGGSAVIEGRDIGSVVFPGASVKVYLDADPNIRARRRAEESGNGADAVVGDLRRRDRKDSTRAASPLSVPDGAVVVDTTHLGVDEVVELIEGLVPSPG